MAVGCTDTTALRIRLQPYSQNLVLVALTGWGQPEDKRRSQEAGFDIHLVKPVDLSALEKLLANMPRSSALINQNAAKNASNEMDPKEVTLPGESRNLQGVS